MKTHMEYCDLIQFPGIFILASGGVMKRQVNRSTRFATSGHAAAIGAMDGYDFTVFKFDIGQKSIVALEQCSGNAFGPAQAPDGF